MTYLFKKAIALIKLAMRIQCLQMPNTQQGMQRFFSSYCICSQVCLTAQKFKHKKKQVLHYLQYEGGFGMRDRIYNTWSKQFY